MREKLHLTKGPQTTASEKIIRFNPHLTVASKTEYNQNRLD